MTYRPPVSKVCNDCPFRRKAMAGWLGAGSPESFIDCINREELLPCHQTIDYDDPDWKAKWMAQVTGNACAGALIMTANMCKQPRDRAFPRLPPNDETVFATPMEFVRHHRDGLAQSWNDEDQSAETKYLHTIFANAAEKSGQPFKKPKKKPSR